MWGRVEHYSVNDSSDIWGGTIYKANIFIFQIAFSQWRAGLIKKLFWDVFLRLASFVFMKNFRFISPALHVLSKKCQIFYHICEKKYFSTKIFTVVHQSKKELLDLDQNWAKTRHLLFKTWKSSISMDSAIVQWYIALWVKATNGV